MAAACLIAACLSAEDAPLPVPEYDEVFYSYDRVAGKLIDLERQESKVDSKPEALGLAGYRVVYFLSGKHSPIRFREGDPLEFIVSLKPRTDPHVLQLFVLRVAGDRRQIVDSVPTRVGRQYVLNKSAVPYDVQKLGDSLYRLVPSKPLAPGEYSLSLSTTQVAYAFGVDRGSGGSKK
jgi:hypothetical protein